VQRQGPLGLAAAPGGQAHLVVDVGGPPAHAGPPGQGGRLLVHGVRAGVRAPEGSQAPSSISVEQATQVGLASRAAARACW